MTGLKFLILGVIIAIPSVLFSWGVIIDKSICHAQPCLSIFNLESGQRSYSVMLGLAGQVLAIVAITKYGMENNW